MNQRSGTAIRAFAALLAMTITLAAVPYPLAAQDAASTFTVVYGDGSTLAVQDWHFVYEYVESDTPLDAPYLATCARPTYNESSCLTQVKIAKDLMLLGPLPGPSGAAKVPYLLPGAGIQAILIHWRGGTGPYEKDGVKLNPERNDGRYQSDALTVVIAQGAEIHFAGRLEALGTFLSSRRYVYLMKLSVAGGIQVQTTPGRFELRLDERFPPASLKERVDEIQFQSGTDRAGLH